MIGKTNIPMGMLKGETVSILLKTNQSSNLDLNGVKVIVTFDNKSHEYVYNGQFSVEIPKDKAYTVSFGEVDGYKTPSSVTYTAMKGFSRNIEAMYYSEFVTVNVSTEDGINVDNKAYVYVSTFDSMPIPIVNGTVTFNIPYDKIYTVSIDNISGYKTPESLTYTASLLTRTINMEYTIGMEKVTVHFTSTDDTGIPQGIYEHPLIVEYDGNNYEYAISAYQATFSIPIGTTYTLIYPDVSGYITPASLTFTAEGETKIMEVLYQEIKLGVFIQGVSGKLYKTDAWTNQETPNGVAVITEECSFVIALTEASSEMKIHRSNSGALNNYMTAISDETQAKADYDGATNTANIMKLQSGTEYAAGWCNAFSFPSGKKGFLPACGQMWAAHNNKTTVDAAITKAGGTALGTDTSYWTSTFRGTNDVNYRSCWVFNWNSGVNSAFLNKDFRVRAFSDL